MTTFKTKEDLKKRLEYVWDFADKNGDIDFLLNELWKDIQATKDEVKEISSKVHVSGWCLPKLEATEVDMNDPKIKKILEETQKSIAGAIERANRSIRIGR